MKVQKKIKVDLSGSELQCPVKVVAGDTAIQLVLEYIGFDIPSGTTATLYVRKPSKKFVYQTDNITISGNVVTIDVNNQAIIESGQAFFNVTLKNGTDEISTFSNYFDIDRNYKDSTAEESKTVITEFESYMQALKGNGKVDLPVDSSGVDYGTAGQFAVSDGKGGISWLTVTNVSEVGM